jgi:biopolymer transport protein ExbD
MVRSTTNGRLAGIVLGERPMSGVAELQASLQELVGDTPEEFEVALEVDERLKYEYVMQIINAISHSRLQAMSFGDLNSAP